MTKDSPFGFTTLPIEDKVSKVQDLFGRVAGQYDLMNDLMSGGIHRLWKDRMIKTLTLNPEDTVLDVAGGTGDIAMRIATEFPYLNLDITICDLTPEMLEVGRRRALDANIIGPIHWSCGKAEALPFPDQSINVYTIAFGLRNVGDIEQALAEAYRVLKPGGRFYCLEFSHVTNPMLAKVYETYSFKILPQMGEWVARDRAAYQYLVESIKRFPTQEALATSLAQQGFTQVKWDDYSCGIAALHQGVRE